MELIIFYFCVTHTIVIHPSTPTWISPKEIIALLPYFVYNVEGDIEPFRQNIIDMMDTFLSNTSA